LRSHFVTSKPSPPRASTNTPLEWLRLTIDPRTPEVFSWENVVYCQTLTCP